MNIKIERIRNIISIFAFLVIVIGGFVMHYDEFKLDFEESYTDVTFENIAEINASMDGVIRDSLQIDLKQKLINIRGCFYKVTSVDVVGNFGMYTNGEYLYLFTDGFDIECLDDVKRELVEIKELAERCGAKLLYVQTMPMYWEGVDDVHPYMETILNYEWKIDKIVEMIAGVGVDFVNMSEYIQDGYRYKTDAHPTMDSSWKALLEILNYMQIKNQEMLDWNQYNIVSNEFLGSYGRNIGEYYLELDEYIRLYPKFETYFSSVDVEYGYTQTGSFEEIVMTNMPKDGGCYYYYVVDFFRYGRPCVVYDNLLNNNGIDVLFICDSFGFQTGAYLSLFVDSMTFMDPRFGGSTKTVCMEDFDYVVIMTHSGLDEDYAFGVIDKDEADIISVEKDEDVLYVCVENIGDGVWNSENLVRLCLYIDGMDSGYRWGIEEDVNVKPGDEYVFEVDISELELSQEQTYSFGMLQEGWSYFDNVFEVNDILFEETETIY